MDEKKWKILESAADITPEIEAAVEDCVDWFDDEPRMGTEEFIDKLCDHYLSGYDLESYDNEAARKIMSIARRIRKERRE